MHTPKDLPHNVDMAKWVYKPLPFPGRVGKLRTPSTCDADVALLGILQLYLVHPAARVCQPLRSHNHNRAGGRAQISQGCSIVVEISENTEKRPAKPMRRLGGQEQVEQ